MTIAPLPDHHRLNAPLWQGLYRAYRTVVLPLRHNGWTTDVELCGGEYHLRADLGDGTELIIASDAALPADPSQVNGWHVLRRPTDGNDNGGQLLYDSTPNGAQRHHGNALVPLFTRIDKLYTARARDGLIVSSCHIAPYGAVHKQTAGIRPPGSGIAQYFTWSDRLREEGYRCVWERPDDEGDPLSVFESVGHIATVRVTRASG
jgi:hypothetical protein